MRNVLRNTLLAYALAGAGLAGAQTPGACSGVLFDNGTFVSQATGGGAGGTDPISIVTTPDTTLGVGLNSAGGLEIAEDFTVPAAGWNVNRLTFYGYQTGSTTTSTLTAVPALTLWNGIPGSGGVAIAGPTSPTLVSTNWSGVYRVSSTAQTGTTRPIMQITVLWPATFPTPLPAGSYWLSWNASGSLASGPFTAPSVANAADNGRQNNAGTWAGVTDGGSARPLGLPFVICGGAAPVSLQGFEIE